MDMSAHSTLKAAFHQARGGFLIVFVVSLFLNLLHLASPIYMMQTFDRVLSTGNVSTLLALTIMIVLALIVLGLLEALRQTLVSRTAAWAGERARGVVVASAFQASLQGAERTAQPLRDLRQVQGFLGGPSIFPLMDAPWAPIFLIVITMMHPALGLVGLIAAIALFGLGVGNEAATRKLTAASNRAQVAAFAGLESTLRNAETAEAMGMTRALMRRWSAVDSQAGAVAEEAGERGGWFSGASKATRYLSQAAILGVGALLVLRGELSSGGMIAASILLGRALAPVEQSISAWKQFIVARESWKRVAAVTERFQPPPPAMPLPAPRAKLIVDNLSYRPNASAPFILRGVGFALEPGEALGVIGASGSGKTTLCRMLTGVVAPTGGVVRLDGADLSLWDKAELGPHVGYLPQGVELFPGTVAENIARMDEPDPQKVVAAARETGLHELILRLPRGYDTPLGENGLGLSAGQRQRVALARALYGQPQFIVLDEPNANLDQAGDDALQAAIAGVKARGGSIVLVAHRPSALTHADKILVLSDGAVAALGPKADILAQVQDGPRVRQVAVGGAVSNSSAA